MIPALIGLLILGIEAVVVNAWPRVNVCTYGTINGFGAYTLILLVFLAILLIGCGFIKYIELLKSNWLRGLAALVLFLACGALAYFASGLLGMQDCRIGY
ncbi:MAG TPA: hypothetical protein VFZ58_03965 [Candidatus Saccharimonadales bacterium]